MFEFRISCLISKPFQDCSGPRRQWHSMHAMHMQGISTHIHTHCEKGEIVSQDITRVTHLHTTVSTRHRILLLKFHIWESDFTSRAVQVPIKHLHRAIQVCLQYQQVSFTADRIHTHCCILCTKINSGDLTDIYTFIISNHKCSEL